MKLGQLQYVLTEAQIKKAVRELRKHGDKNVKPHCQVFDEYIEADTWDELETKIHNYVVEQYEEEEKDNAQGVQEEGMDHQMRGRGGVSDKD